MLVVTAFYNGDASQAERLFEWCAELDGIQPHPCLLVASKGMDDDRVQAVRVAAQKAFREVSIVRPLYPNEKGWPESPNHLFTTACACIAKNFKKPFFWLEPDCVPLKPGWLEAIDTEYINCGKPYMGFNRPIPTPHITGVAVYPAQVARYNPDSLKPYRNKFGAVPFDLVCPEKTLRNAHETKLIQHDWGTRESPPSFKSPEDLQRLSPEAVLFHRTKDDGLVSLLRERRKKTTVKEFISKAVEVFKPKPSSAPAIIGNPKVDLLYICVRRPSEPEVPRDFNMCHERFAKTYLQFKPAYPHRLIVVCYNGERDADTDRIFGPLNPTYMYYVGEGFDVGCYQAIGRTLDSDFAIFCGSQIHFYRNGWMERLIEAFKKHGEGIYSPMASYERTPHLRTCCVAMPPKLMRKYPYLIDTRVNTYKAESGEWNITQWVRQQNKPALMVTWDAEYEQPDWRKPANIFRRGDQSNCLLWDRHTKVYFDSNAADKASLAKSADGDGLYWAVPPPTKGRKSYKTITIVAATSLNAKGHAKAIDWTAALIPHPTEKLLISPDKLDGFDGKQLPLPEPWAKNGKWELDDMCDFLLFGLHRYIKTDVAIIVHDDGYALNKSKWSDDFLTFDYIGAPWPASMGHTAPGRQVGNGGFSLRSRKWLELASTLPKLPRGVSEDVYVSVRHRDHFTNGGCDIAPVDVAIRWGLEYPIAEYPNWKLADSFGFHGRTTNDPVRKYFRLR